MSRKTVTIVDTFGFFFRSFYALPPLTNENGFPTGLLTGFLNFIAKLNHGIETDYLVFCLESKTGLLRKEIYPEYKAHRSPAPEELKQQLPVAIEWIEKMGFATLTADGYESDDLIATVTNAARKADMHVRIISHDKDMYQLIDDGNVVMFDASKGTIVDEEGCFAKFGVKPKDFIHFQSLLGDSSDNIPGVKGIGQKTAAKLVNEFGTLDAIYENLDKVAPARMQNALRENKENAYLSKQLVTLHPEALKTVDFDALKLPEGNPILSIAGELEEYGIRAVLNRAQKGKAPAAKKLEDEKPKESDFRFKAVTLDDEAALMKVIDSIPADAVVAFDTETDDLDTRKAGMVGFSFAFDDETAYYAPVAHHYLGVGPQVSLDAAKKAIRALAARKLVGQNLKFDLALVENALGIKVEEPHADTMLMAWLADPSNPVGLDTLAKKFLNHEMISFKETVKKGETFASVEIEKATQYAAEDAMATFRLFFILKDLLEKQDPGLWKELQEVEMPFIRVLIAMENRGIALDPDHFRTLKEQTDGDLDLLIAEIHKMAGREFNINSTQQLGVVLFEELQLPRGKKTKTGWSTNEQVLQGLADQHPVIPLLLEYRERFKLKSTYIEPLLEIAAKDENHRVYTSFLQTGTATGRLASKNPNLQNIPVKTELGRAIRHGFVPRPGYKLLGLDYSQIELRLLAHYSKDPTLVQAFLDRRDIHLETARKIFGDALAAEKRPLAKSVNFGLLYGMGPKKLSETVNIPMKEAKEVIQSYFASFPTVKSFLEEVKELSKTNGYVETLAGRRRYFPYDTANGMQKAMFEREAANSIFQGSAADIIKMSMNAIELETEIPEAELLLQIHDELVFEVKEEAAESAGAKLREIMENVVQLDVPLETSLNLADSWGDLK